MTDYRLISLLGFSNNKRFKIFLFPLPGLHATFPKTISQVTFGCLKVEHVIKVQALNDRTDQTGPRETQLKFDQETIDIDQPVRNVPYKRNDWETFRDTSLPLAA